jgi:cell shape-determining protein MreD
VRYGFYLMVTFGLLLAQTIFMPQWSVFDRFYDLLVPVVVYLGLFRPFKEGLPVVVLLGFIQDSITGGPFGLYLTSYFWIFMGVAWVITFLRVTNTLLLIFVVAAAVLVENLIFFGTVTLAGAMGRMPADPLGGVAVQVGWALVTGPVALVVFDMVQGILEKWREERLAEREA